MSLRHNMFPHLLIYPQIFLLLREVRRGRRASSSPSTRYAVELVSFLALKKTYREEEKPWKGAQEASEKKEWQFSFLLNE